MLAVVLTFLLAIPIQGSAKRPLRHKSELHVLLTGDVHGSWFSEPYVGEGKRLKPSLEGVKYLVDSVRNAVGEDNVLLLDAGDCLQGDNAAFFFNYENPISEHLFPRIVSYMGYDAVVVGNHDIETGHKVYDAIEAQLKEKDIPYLAGNALKADGTSYFPEYKVFYKAGLKVLVLGYTNPNIPAWLNNSLWSGMEFKSLVPFVQQRVDAIKEIEKPQVTIVLVHSGTGSGDGAVLENQGLDLFKSLKGVDLVCGAHDHSPIFDKSKGIVYMNTGSKAAHLGHVTLINRPGARPSKSARVELLKVRPDERDMEMVKLFRPDYQKVKDFTLRKVADNQVAMRTSDAFKGMCPYMDLVHTVQLKSSGAQISLAAPLTFNKGIRAGELIYNDLFTIYPYENDLYKIKLTGKQIKDYLEFSYTLWLGEAPGKNLLNIRQKDDPRNAQLRWSFADRTYNFDSAAGINYTVNALSPSGERITITSLADGTPFDPEAEYTVAISSYRGSGGGDHLTKGCGLAKESLDALVAERYNSMRDLIYSYICNSGAISAQAISDRKLLGEWHFVPEEAAQRIEADWNLLFAK